MTKDEFKDKYLELVGSDLCGPTTALRIRSEKIINKSVCDTYEKELFLKWNDEICKTFQVLENAIFELCD